MVSLPHGQDAALKQHIDFCLQIWRELFSPLHALNFGIGGDTTGHVLWRLKNGELENIKPKIRAAELVRISRCTVKDTCSCRPGTSAFPESSEQCQPQG